jgi:mannose-6-phosphate isomerase class I
VDRRPCQSALLGELAAGQEPLDQLIAEAPEAILGLAAKARFGGRLPYLFKILDVHKMLSIQAHPTLAQARAGFARENAEGIRWMPAAGTTKTTITSRKSAWR